MVFGCLAPSEKFVPMAWDYWGETSVQYFVPTVQDLLPTDVRLANVEFYFEIAGRL
jgi:hypothetical protein